MKSGTRNPERRKLKKDFLNNKKKNKKRKTNKFYNYQADKDGTDTGTAAAAEETEARNYFGNNQPEEKSFSTYADDYVRFGEQATRPPQFQNIPRGASKSKNANNINVRMHHTNHTTRREEEEGGHSATTAKTTTTTMSNAQVQAEHDAMELMKRKIQAQYRAIKVKRQQQNRY
jgi:hypothetical protein